MKKTLGILIFSYLVLVLTGCPELEVCVVDGATYQVGDGFRSSDGCNTCTCEEGGKVSCTAMACADGCDYNGKHYEIGDTFEDADGCNTCSCEPGGAVACTEMACPEGCDYNGQHYAVGDTFDDIDGCNTCSCVDDNQVACTEMACPPEECEPGERMFEPGCGGEFGIVPIEAGCYQPCGPYGDTPCKTGVCQRTDINPCVCKEGEVCCDACGQEYWLCLPLPEKEVCLSTSRDPIVLSASRSFGECMGECKYDLKIFESHLDVEYACDMVSLSVCTWNQKCPRKNQGSLTPLGHARARALAAELLDTKLQKIYGCPDCADGGASGFTVRRYGTTSSHTYEYSNPPKVLAAVDQFSQGLIDALNTCEPNEHIEINPGCTPRSW